jgi:beta-galactosidase/beta-glucuronidase
MKSQKSTSFFLIILFVLTPVILQAQSHSWKPKNPRLTTPWTSKVSPNTPHNKYPRPQMVREKWKNLNGLWDYAITSSLKQSADNWEGQILVPYPIESALSGVKKQVTPDQKIWYKRTFTIPNGWNGQRVLLHFGAVDWKANVWVNGHKVGDHQGGYGAFTFDITDELKTEGKQQITVSVWDPSDAGYQPHGKQSLHPRGIWYTSASGIWQTVWLEPVPDVSISKLKLTPDIDHNLLHIKATGNKKSSAYTVKAVAYADGKQVGKIRSSLGKTANMPIHDMKLWSPKHPFLYDLTVTILKNGHQVDQVKSYFGMRKIQLGHDQEGYVRLFLNNKPLFEFGPLDQGYWPDGIYTAPTDDALEYDIKMTKALGFNMIRKHVKVEPQRWYYYTDKIGLLVWQDMPSGDKHIQPNEKDIHRVAQSAHDFKMELDELIAEHYNHPSIVTWVPFNEGWGQFQTARIAKLVKKLDPTRLVDCPTGWQDRGVGDMHDIHKYPGPAMPDTESDRAAVLGEFGGQALVVKGHLWLNDFSKAPSHYKTSQSRSKLHHKYDDLIDKLIPLKRKGLAAAVYTQTTDVEIEVNGLMTYDRKVLKFDKDHLKEINQKVIHGTY